MRFFLLFLVFFINLVRMAYGREGLHCCNQRNMGVSRIYGLYFQGELRYIGQTTHSLQCRLSNHISKARKSNRKTPVTCWIRSILNLKELPQVKLIEEVVLKDADEAERFWIATFSSDRLKNFSEGGNMCGFLGKKHSPETRKQMSISAQNRKWSMSDEAKRRLSERSKTRKHSPEEIEKRRKSITGKKRSPEHCKMQSERMKADGRYKKAVISINTNGDQVTYKSIREAAKIVGVAHPNISRAAKNPDFTSGGFKWKYVNGH